MTNGWDVLTDAIKIGVPSLLTGLVTFFIARGTRRHERDKERRNRKIEFLISFAELIDDFESKLNAVSGAQGTDLEQHTRQDAAKASSNLFRQLSKFTLFGMKQCKSALIAYIVANKYLDAPSTSEKRSVLLANKSRATEKLRESLEAEFNKT